MLEMKILWLKLAKIRTLEKWSMERESSGITISFDGRVRLKHEGNKLQNRKNDCKSFYWKMFTISEIHWKKANKFHWEKHALHPSFIFFGLFIRSCASPFHFSLPSKVANNPMRIQRLMDAKNPHTHSLRTKTSWPSFIQHALWGFCLSLKQKKLENKTSYRRVRWIQGSFPKMLWCLGCLA